MRNIKSKIGAYAVVLALMGTLVPVLGGVKLDKSVAAGDNVAAIGTTEYATLQAAVDAVTGTTETTIKLLKNIETTASVIVDSKNVKLDLGTYSISANVADDAIKVTGTGLLTIESDKNGAVNNTNSDAGASAIHCGPKAKLVINSGTYSVSGTNAASVECLGAVELNEGTYTNNILVYCDDVANYESGKNVSVVINGGKYESYIRPLTVTASDEDALALNYVKVKVGAFKLQKDQAIQGIAGDSTVGAYATTKVDSILDTGVQWPASPKNGYYLVHKHDEKVVLDGKPATCTEKGKTEGTQCSICGEVSKTQTDIPAKGHSVSDMIPAKEPTRHEEGYYSHYRCSTCGKYFEDKAGTKELQASVVVRPALIDVATKKGVATIDKSIIEDAIKAYQNKQEDEDDKYVELMFADVDKTVTTFNLPTQAVRAITNAGEAPNTMIVLPSGAIILFDVNALNAMVAESGNAEYIELSMKPITAADMNEKQQAAIKDLKVEMLVSAAVYCNGTYLKQFGEKGLSIVLIPFKGEKNIDYSLIHIAEDGKINETLSDTTTYENNEYMLLLTDHFSEYAIVNNGLDDDDDDDDDDKGTVRPGGTTSGGTGSSGTTGGASSSGKVQNVATGDEANMTPWICILVGSVVAIVGVGIFAKKKKIW